MAIAAGERYSNSEADRRYDNAWEQKRSAIHEKVKSGLSIFSRNGATRNQGARGRSAAKRRSGSRPTTSNSAPTSQRSMGRSAAKRRSGSSPTTSNSASRSQRSSSKASASTYKPTINGSFGRR